MPRSRGVRFRDATFTRAWQKSYDALDPACRRQCDTALRALIKGEHTPGLRIHPILPSRYFLEARINSDDRIVFRIQEDTIFFVEIVRHDDLYRYSQPRG